MFENEQENPDPRRLPLDNNVEHGNSYETQMARHTY